MDGGSLSPCGLPLTFKRSRFVEYYHDIFSCSLISMHRHNIIILQGFNALTSSYICVTALPSAA